MLIGVPKEIKNKEYRVGLTPAGIKELVSMQHEVFVQSDAGLGAGFDDDAYAFAGATIIDDAQDIYDQAQMIVKVKEPQPDECFMLSEDQIIFTYLHLAADIKQVDLLMRSGANAIAYETVEDPSGRLPLLAPMSEVAGRMSIQAGAHCLEKRQGGSGVLLSGLPGVPEAEVCILGGGVVGLNAAKIALGMGARVSIIDKSIARLREIDQLYQGRISTIYSTQSTIIEALSSADLVVGAVLIPGAAAPKLVSKSMLQGMKPGSVLVDVAIDQGGCFETSRPTSHDQPCYIIDGIVHYCVTNIPGAVARTSTLGLTNATLPYVIRLANEGLNALDNDVGFAKGLNIFEGEIVCDAVLQAYKKHIKS